MGTLQDSGVFDGCQITIDFAVSSLPFKRKQEIRREVVENGGILSYILTRQTSFLVTGNPERTLSSYKGRSAVKCGIPVVSFDFITECVEADKLIDPQSYLLSETPESQNFSSGKIAAKTQTNKGQKKVVKKCKVTDLSKIRVWPYKEAIDGPVFDEEKYEIVKDVVLQALDSTGSISTFFALELHVIPSFGSYTGWKCRVFSHRGNLKEVREGNVGCKECMYFFTVEEALEAYIALYQQQAQPPFSTSKDESLLSHRIGSEKMMQLTMADQCCDEDSVILPQVANLVDGIWNEATGSLADILAGPVDSIKLEDVEKAEAILLVMKKALDANEGEAAINNLSDEFYAVIRHKNSGQQIQSKLLIAQKQDLCQLIRDMVSIGEATNWLPRRGAHAKYRALKTHIECLPHHSKEFKEIKAYITSSKTSPEEIQVLNVYSVHRPVEERAFSCDTGNRKLLFHASKVSSFVGILSRGLLLPKVIVDDFGGKRSDAGMLGSGIYFASSASTSAKYSTPSSKGSRTRLMLINEVALGKVKDFRNFSMDLVSPPVGYDSCHGVRATDNEPSDFKDDEYAVYKSDQQKIRYLVEFVLPGDVLLPRDDISLDSGFSDDDVEVTEEDSSVDLSDVMSVVDPLAKVEAGLKGTGDKPIPLRAVHIKAKLLDLAAQVVVFQAYKNTSSVPIEAKYVFPLDDMAAVCGFEAFINGKHIVGEVKEKEQAHKEYREAISQGHGAYLMDEETPDIFTVNVGNLPSGAQVLIKITYVAELMVDKEHISFTLPGSVAPWKRSKALEKLIQRDVDTIHVEDEQPSDFSAQISVEMPFDIRTITSPSHPINIKRTATKAVVELEPGYPLGDGFQLLIGLAEIHVPRMWVERHVTNPDSQACMLTFYPEFEAESPQEVEVVFLLDLSCSMKGSSLQDAKKILLMCLSHMKENWVFNIIVFGSKHAELFPCSKRKDKQAHQEAVEYITPLKATKGSTELWRVLHKLYLLPCQSAADHPRNVFLISDGHVTEEETTLQLIRKHCQSNRLFAFGVGPTANRYLLRAMSKLGAGASEFFDSKAKSKWEKKIKGQLSNAEQPGLTSVAVTWQQHDSSANAPIQAPHQLLSLFNGSRQVVYGFADNCTQAILTAEVNGKTVSTMVSTADLNITTGKILHQLTARAIIRDWDEGSLHDQRTGHEVAKRSRKNYIISLSKEFSLVSKFTSFVAVERREKDEIFVEGLGPSIEQLVALEDVDILKYMSWEERPPAIELEKCKMSTEERLENLLKEAMVLETCAVLQAECQYRDILKEASEKLGCEHALTNTVKSQLFKLNTSLVGEEDKSNELYEEDYDDVESEAYSSSSESSMSCPEEVTVESMYLDHDELLNTNNEVSGGANGVPMSYSSMQLEEQMEETSSEDGFMLESTEEDESDGDEDDFYLAPELECVEKGGERGTFGEKEEEEERELAAPREKVFREEPCHDLGLESAVEVPPADHAVAAVRMLKQKYKLQAEAPAKLEQAEGYSEFPQFSPHDKPAGHPPPAESSISLRSGSRSSRRSDVLLEEGMSQQQDRSPAVLSCDEIYSFEDQLCGDNWLVEVSEPERSIQARPSAPAPPPPPPATPPPPPAPTLPPPPAPVQTETKPMPLVSGRGTEKDKSMRKSLLKSSFPRSLALAADSLQNREKAEGPYIADHERERKGKKEETWARRERPQQSPYPRSSGFSFAGGRMRAHHTHQALCAAEPDLMSATQPWGMGLEVPARSALHVVASSRPRKGGFCFGSSPGAPGLFGLVPPSEAISRDQFKAKPAPPSRPGKTLQPHTASLFGSVLQAHSLLAAPTPFKIAVQNQASPLEMPAFGLPCKEPAIPVPTASFSSGFTLDSSEVPSDGNRLRLQEFSTEPAEGKKFTRKRLREESRSTGVSFGEMKKDKDEAVQSGTESLKKMEQIFAKQNPEGYWKIADLPVIGIDTLKAVQILIDAGAKSLGARKFEDIQMILATLIMLAFVKMRLLVDITISPPLGKTSQTKIIGAAEQYAVNVTLALRWIKNQERKIPFLFSRLELGANWTDAAERVLEGAGA